ncbi:hypothetical protein L873DRAFT_1796191 [Choiromyces venosus 120613-1]|uniref:Uncharacterized protein n=1 Tax=Choiromyces venosus 120613-1 TaxID=1336337 RepID=A0A3N4IWE6_9PEZI|nr:hypothetical protein L873DRAFT_1796191 [Choiromyces venosus 120613-1]
MILHTSRLTTSQEFPPLYNLQSLPVASPIPSSLEEPFSPSLTRSSSRIESVIRVIYLQIDKLEKDQRVTWEAIIKTGDTKQVIYATVTRNVTPVTFRKFVESPNTVTQDAELFQLLQSSRIKATQVESVLSQKKKKTLTKEKVKFLSTQGYKGLTVALIHDKKASLVSNLATILSEEKSNLKGKLQNTEIHLLPVEQLAKNLFQDKIFSAAKPAHKDNMKVSAEKWRLVTEHLVVVKITAARWWLQVYDQLVKLHDESHSDPHLSLMNSKILYKDEENLRPNNLDNNSTLIDDSTRIIIDDSDESMDTDSKWFGGLENDSDDGNDGTSRNNFDEADILRRQPEVDSNRYSP